VVSGGERIPSKRGSFGWGPAGLNLKRTTELVTLDKLVIMENVRV
jgi:hypothetical protein